MINFRAVFDELRISWRDRGKNCSRGRINITCPWCDDPSEHLSVDETEDQFYCWRCQEGGHSLIRLFTRLGVDYHSVSDLLNRHNTDVAPTVKKVVKPATAITKAWQRFEPAADSDICTRYLQSRGFPSPVSTCRQYDLRMSPAGSWAQRLLVPVNEAGVVVTWVGRALRPDLDPKYLLEPCDHPVIYVPREPRKTLVLVEGSLDALKIAVATNAMPVSSAALLGKGYAPDKISRITELAKDCSYILVAMDSDVSIVSVHGLIHELAINVQCPVKHLPIPSEYKDPGEMEMDKINDWIVNYLVF